MKDFNLEINEEDILALEKILKQIKEFSDKNPIKKYKIDYDRIKDKINQLSNILNIDNELKYKLLNSILKKLKGIIKQEVLPRSISLLGGMVE